MLLVNYIQQVSEYVSVSESVCVCVSECECVYTMY